MSNLTAYKSLMEEDDNYYFSQNHKEVFFADYFYEDTTNYIKQFCGFIESDASSTWLHRLSAPGSQLFCEMLTVALRIEATPDSILELIIDSALGKIYEFYNFKQHVLSMKKSAMSVLYSLFDSIDTHLVDNFKRTKGPQIMTSFVDDIENFIATYSVYPEGNCLNDYLIKHSNVLGDYLKYIKLETLYLGTLINLPWPLPAIDIENSRGMPVSEFIALFNASLKVIDDNWDTIISFPELGIWQHVNYLANYLNDMPTGSVVKHASRTFLIPLFVFAAKNSLNHLCKILLIENQFIAYAVLNQSKYSNWVFIGLIGDSIDECLEKFNNIEILALVNETLSSSRRFGGSRARSITLHEESDLLPQAGLKAIDMIETKSPTRNTRRKSFFKDEGKPITPSIPRNKSNLESLISAPYKRDYGSKLASVDDDTDTCNFFDSVL